MALLLFAPVIVWNAKHHWASFAFQGPRRLLESFDITLPALIGSIFLLLTPTEAFTAFAALFPKTEENPKKSEVEESAGRRSRLFAAFSTFSPLLVFLVFLAFSFVRNAKLTWTGSL